MDLTLLDQRPIVVALAGPNGAGKTTFYRAHLARTGLPFVNADLLSHELDVDPYSGAHLADSLRRALVARGASFVFETVLSDPVGDKAAFLEGAVEQGYTVVLCYLGLDSADQSAQRVQMRVSQGGHDGSILFVLTRSFIWRRPPHYEAAFPILTVGTPSQHCWSRYPYRANIFCRSLYRTALSGDWYAARVSSPCNRHRLFAQQAKGICNRSARAIVYRGAR